MSYNNTLFIQGGQDVANEDAIRLGEHTRPFWYKHGGVETPRYPSWIFWFLTICATKGLENISSELLNERDAFEGGKRRARLNDGRRFSTTVEFKGNEIQNLMSMLGKVTHNTSSTTVSKTVGLEHGKDYGVQGSLILSGMGKNRRAFVSTVLTDVGIRVLDAPGLTDGESTYVVELYSDGELYRAPHGYFFVPFMFYDNGTITNTAAPDGTATTFDLKNFNYAFATAPTAPLLAGKVRDDAGLSNLDAYVLNPRLDGAAVTNTQASFNPATGVITFNAAPADGAKLEGIVCIPTGFPSWVAGTYNVGQIVLNSNNEYWLCTPASGTTTTEDPATTTPADWTQLTDQTFPVPLYADYDGIASIARTANKQHPSQSWQDFNSP